MKKLNDLELNNVKGGMTAWALIGIGIAVTFVAGIFDGIARPHKCRN